MNKINKLLISFTSMIFISNNIMASEVVVSENFLKHEYCKNVKEISFSSSVNSKATMFELLKKEVKELNANTAINTIYEVSMFDTRTISAVAANCDIEKSPELFAKSSDMMAYNQRDISNDYSNDKVFTSIAILYDSVKMNVESNLLIGTQNKSSGGIGFKVGMLEKNYRYYADVKIATGISLSGSLDYIYALNNEYSLITGLSLSMGSYTLDDIETISGLQKGIQFAISKDKYEIGFQYLDGGLTKSVANTNFKLANTMYIYTAYRF